MNAEFTNKALKDLRKLNKITQKQIIKKLNFYLKSPKPLDYAEKLTDFKDGDYRFRIGAYRITFDVETNTIMILRVQHRREIYRSY